MIPLNTPLPLLIPQVIVLQFSLTQCLTFLKLILILSLIITLILYLLFILTVHHHHILTHFLKHSLTGGSGGNHQTIVAIFNLEEKFSYFFFFFSTIGCLVFCVSLVLFVQVFFFISSFLCHICSTNKRESKDNLYKCDSKDLFSNSELSSFDFFDQSLDNNCDIFGDR